MAVIQLMHFFVKPLESKAEKLHIAYNLFYLKSNVGVHRGKMTQIVPLSRPNCSFEKFVA